MSTFLSNELIKAANAHGLQGSEIIRQLNLFKKGIKPVQLKRACTVGDGIIRFEDELISDLIQLYESKSRLLKVGRFVPASGAASRMFKNLQALLNNHETIDKKTLQSDSEEAVFGQTFIEGIHAFAFYDALKKVMAKDSLSIESLIQKEDYFQIIEYLLTDKGLNYASLPKALIQFHSYNSSSRTSIEEHFHESMLYGLSEDGKIHLHFTVSPEFEEAIRSEIERIRKKLEKPELLFDVEISFQQPSTDTIAVDINNEPFLNEDGSFLFRPGGHGALLDNLNTLSGDVVFIKNIDNVVPDYLKPETEKWKKVLGGFLMNQRNKIFNYLQELEKDNPAIEEIQDFCTHELYMPAKVVHPQNKSVAIKDLRSKLNRPIRVCGMVKNEGEPGGGPFWVKSEDGSVSLQIVESSQINLNDSTQNDILQNSTHFNPVDIVCTLNNYKGEAFELNDFVNPDTAFIAEKSSGGRKLKALERPGLWNGAMEKWITFFVEVPVETFNPVKTINDLLRPQHQPNPKNI